MNSTHRMHSDESRADRKSNKLFEVTCLEKQATAFGFIYRGSFLTMKSKFVECHQQDKLVIQSQRLTLIGGLMKKPSSALWRNNEEEILTWNSDVYL